MNYNYTKTALYAYPNIEAVMDQIDDFVERKALSSMSDFSPCLEQCEKILDYTAQKDALINLKLMIKSVLLKLSPLELDLLDYKYFKQKDKEYYVDFDSSSRKYFRRQVSLIKKVAFLFEKEGLTDEWFNQNCLTSNFFKELLKRVQIQELQSKKNKSKKVKITCEKATIEQQLKLSA